MSEVLRLEMNGAGSVFTDSSASAHTITTAGTVAQIPTVYTFSTTAFYMDGDSDYIQLPDNATYDYGTGDFTLEGWFMFRSTASYQTFFCTGTAATGIRVLSDRASHNQIEVQIKGAAYNSDASTWNPSTYTWYHIALVRSSATVDIYVDGTALAGGGTSNDDITASAGGPQVGHSHEGYYLNGWAKDVRFSNAALYQPSGFTPSTTLLTTAASTQLLLNAHQPTDQKNPLCSTAWFDGNSDYLSVPSASSLTIGTGALTVEGWFRWHTEAGGHMLFSTGAQSTGGYGLFYNGTTNNLGWATSGSFKTNPSWTAPTDKWTHIAVVRNATTSSQIYIDGVKLGAAAADNANLNIMTKDLYIGTGYGAYASSFADVWCKELRISKTNRYTDNFTPSTTLFENDSDTLLLLHLNGTPDDTDNTNGWLTESSSQAHTVTANVTAACKYIEDYRNRIIVDSSPNAHIATTIAGTTKLDWIAAEGSAAAWIDGNSDCLSIADSDDWDWGTGAWTVGFWWKNIVAAGSGDYYWANTNFATGSTLLNSSGLELGVKNNKEVDTSYVFRITEWYYIESARVGDTVYLFANGSLLGVGDVSGVDITGLAGGFTIGASTVPDNFMTESYIDYFRIDKGTGDHSAPFIPPTYATSAAPTSPSVSTRRVFIIT